MAQFKQEKDRQQQGLTTPQRQAPTNDPLDQKSTLATGGAVTPETMRRIISAEASTALAQVSGIKSELKPLGFHSDAQTVREVLKQAMKQNYSDGINTTLKEMLEKGVTDALREQLRFQVSRYLSKRDFEEAPEERPSPQESEEDEGELNKT